MPYAFSRTISDVLCTFKRFHNFIFHQSARWVYLGPGVKVGSLFWSARKKYIKPAAAERYISPCQRICAAWQLLVVTFPLGFWGHRWRRISLDSKTCKEGHQFGCLNWIFSANQIILQQWNVPALKGTQSCHVGTLFGCPLIAGCNVCL